MGVAPWAGRAGHSPPPGSRSAVRVCGAGRGRRGPQREESGRRAGGSRRALGRVGAGPGRATRALVQEQGCRSDPVKGRFSGRVRRKGFGKDALRPGREEGLNGITEFCVLAATVASVKEFGQITYSSFPQYSYLQNVVCLFSLLAGDNGDVSTGVLVFPEM